MAIPPGPGPASTLAGFPAWVPAHCPVARDMTAAPSSQASQSLSTTSTNSPARSYRSAAGGCGWSPKLPAAAGSTVVTMFQPARPWLR